MTATHRWRHLPISCASATDLKTPAMLAFLFYNKKLGEDPAQQIIRRNDAGDLAECILCTP